MIIWLSFLIICASLQIDRKQSRTTFWTKGDKYYEAGKKLYSTE